MINIVAIEGLDGSGKSTFAENVVVILNKIAKNVHVEYVHFPDYTLQSGKEILATHSYRSLIKSCCLRLNVSIKILIVLGVK